ncbi:MAG: hypothetical protein DRQ49_02525 [Gammaproteobacteria bacterium]|nr:MAG: hypothetical protein DRQ49_02525 [Gammaproteobacteria bacterium]
MLERLIENEDLLLRIVHEITSSNQSQNQTCQVKTKPGRSKTIRSIDVQINHFTKGNHKGLPLPANMLSVGAIPCGCPVK